MREERTRSKRLWPKAASHPENDERCFELAILYDAARGFLGLMEKSAILRHAMLSLMGACGVNRVAVWERRDDGIFVQVASRGADGAAAPPPRISERDLRVLLHSPGPHTGESESISPGLRNWITRSGFAALGALPHQDRVERILVFGRKLLGEPLTTRDLVRLRELSELSALALATFSRRTDHTEEPIQEARSGGRRDPLRQIELLRARSRAVQAIIGAGPATESLLLELAALAECDLPVLIQGETGTGKELAARAIHELSPQAAAPFEAINCAAIPADLMSSALFGHERGAFTGAVARARGAFERAGDGTIFLDEVGDMPPPAQASLLRVLQEREFRRVGGEEGLPARARVISASNIDLAQAVRDGRFRPDLFYRIQMYSLRVPPLRERLEEIPALVAHVLESARDTRGPAPVASPEFLAALRHRSFPGNIRELEGLVLSAAVRARGAKVLRPEHLPPVVPEAVGRVPAPGIRASSTDRDGHASDRKERSPDTEGRSSDNEGDSSVDRCAEHVMSYDQMEREYVRSILRLTEGNKKEAAALMGIPRTTLNARIKRLGA